MIIQTRILKYAWLMVWLTGLYENFEIFNCTYISVILNLY